MMGLQRTRVHDALTCTAVSDTEYFVSILMFVSISPSEKRLYKLLWTAKIWERAECAVT